MKKLLILGGLIAAGVIVWRRVQEDKATKDLWTEVTDPV